MDEETFRFAPQELRRLVTQKGGLSRCSDLVWLKRGEQHILLVGEYHEAATCDSEQSFDVRQWVFEQVESRHCELVLELHHLARRRETISDRVDLVGKNLEFFHFHFRENRSNVVFGDNRRDFWVDMENVNFMMQLAHRNPALKQAMAKWLNESTLFPFWNAYSAISQYAETLRNDVQKMTESDAKVYQDAFDVVTDAIRDAAFDDNGNMNANLDSVFMSYQTYGQQLSDLHTLRYLLNNPQKDFVCWNGRQHVPYLSSLLEACGYQVMAIGAPAKQDTNCIQDMKIVMK